MANRVVMPKLTDTMEEGVVLKWAKKEGDSVGAGDVLAEIETDKAVMDLEAFTSGILRRVVVNEGDTVPSGALIAVIGEPDEDISSALSETMAAGQTVTEKSPTISEVPPPPTQAPISAPHRKSESLEPSKNLHIKISPRAKALARERGIDVKTVKGSGPDGRIIEKDVLHAEGASRARAEKGIDQPLSQMRKAIARATTQSKAPVPHFYVTSEINMDEAERFRSQYNAIRSDHLRVNDLIVKASAMALAKYPNINVSFGGETMRQHSTIDIGIAVGLEDGLIVPVLHDCGRKTFRQIAKEIRSLIRRARKRELSPEEYTGATFTVSNLGMYEVENFIAVLMPPEAAALAVGSLREVPVVQGSRVRAARHMKVTLSCDHRVLDGVQAATFLKEFKRLLEHPLELVLDQEGSTEV